MTWGGRTQSLQRACQVSGEEKHEGFTEPSRTHEADRHIVSSHARDCDRVSQCT